PRTALAEKQAEFYAKEMQYGNPIPFAESPEARDRAALYVNQGTDLIYRGLLERVRKQVDAGAKLSDLAPDYAKVLDGRAEFDAVFSPAGWTKMQAALKSGNVQLDNDPCLGAKLKLSSLKFGADSGKAIESLYAKDYIEAWRKYVAQFRVRRYANPADAANKLEVLVSNRSPLLALMALTANNTNYPKSEGGGIAIPAALDRFVPGALKKGKKAAETIADKLPSRGEPQLSVGDIPAVFQPVHVTVPPASEKWYGEKNATYMNGLMELRDAMLSLSRDLGDKPNPALHQAAQQAYDKAMNAVLQFDRNFNAVGYARIDQEVRRLLKAPIEGTDGFIIKDFEKVASGKVGQDLSALCRKMKPALLSKYPFDSRGTDLPLAELGAYFAPVSGAIWKFQAASAAEFTVAQDGQWMQNPAKPTPKASPELLNFLNNSQQIASAFFAPGSAQPYFTYTLRPQFDNDSVEPIIKLSIDGKVHEFTKSATRQQQFTWPAAAAAEAVGRTGTKGFSSPFSSHDGVWAVFRMFGDAEPRPVGSKTVEWKKSRGPTGRFEPIEPPVRLQIVESPGGADVFNPDFYARYSCPTVATK
ncbi:MAG: ImcF-related family protein, partial [Bryobacteraceae bacterium]